MNPLLPTLQILCNQLARFFVAGGLATLVHWSVIAVLIWQTMLPLYATIAGAIVGSIVNYLFQFHWVFNAKHRHRHVVPSYVGVVILGWCLNAGLFYLLSSFTQADIGYVQLYTTLMVAAINFITYKRIVFHERTI